MRIGAAARVSGVPAKTIRYYESIGLIPKAERGDNAYRNYDEDDVAVLRFIQRARRFDFSIADVAELLSLWRDEERSAAQVRDIALAHLDALRAKRKELEAMERTIQDLVDRCHGGDRPDCPILADLDPAEDSP